MLCVHQHDGARRPDAAGAALGRQRSGRARDEPDRKHGRSEGSEPSAPPSHVNLTSHRCAQIRRSVPRRAGAHKGGRRSLRAGQPVPAHARVVADGQVGKQTALVEYVGGVEFRQRVESVLEPVVALADDLEKEKRSLETAWARREKRHEQIVRGAAGLWGDVSGIVGTLAPPKQLQLPAAKEDEKDAV